VEDRSTHFAGIRPTDGTCPSVPEVAGHEFAPHADDELPAASEVGDPI
jgi:hypothetical protein